MKDEDLKKLRSDFIQIAEQDGFEAGVAEVAMRLNALVGNADNWQIVFDLLYWDWTAKHENIHPSELDRISLKYSRFGEHQEAVIRQQVRSANEWRTALEEAGISPVQALSLARGEAEFIVDEEKAKSAIAEHPSPILIPLRLVQLYRTFYRTEKRYGFSNTDAIKPLLRAKEVISKSHRDASNEELVMAIGGDIQQLMQKIRAGSAKGRWVIPQREKERAAIYEFAEFVVHYLLAKRFRGDRSQFSSKTGIGLIEDACLYLFHLEQDKENRANSKEVE